jgi:hypothetical protein
MRWMRRAREPEERREAAAAKRGGTKTLQKRVPYLMSTYTWDLRRPSPSSGYQLQADAIRSWEASRAAVAAAMPIPAAQWPAAVATLSPDNVAELPGKRGVGLEWGQLAAWGTSRRVFIAADPSIAPPSEDEYIHFAWRSIGLGALGYDYAE